MACYHPLQGWRSKEINSKTGKRSIVFNTKYSLPSSPPVVLPCGQCPGCKLERSRQWAIRCQHEASLHSKNSFITLTYDNKNLPYDGSLQKKHYQLFMKKLRKELEPKKIRYYHCGEYGEQFGRPHYHACLFGHDWDDKTLFKIVNKQRLYISDTLTRIWGMGHATTGSVTFKSAAYVARYIMKKVNGDDADEHYNRPFEHTDPITGEIFLLHTTVQSEYTTMSRAHGIGYEWFQKYSSDVFPDDFIIVNGRKMRTPKYYDNLLELSDPGQYEHIKSRRLTAAKKHEGNNTPERLAVREKIQLIKLKKLKRSLQ